MKDRMMETMFWDMAELRTKHIYSLPEYTEVEEALCAELKALPFETKSKIQDLYLRLVNEVVDAAYVAGVFTGLGTGSR